MKEGTTSTGFAYTIEDERLDDYETFELLCELDEGKTAVLPKVIKALLGDEQEKALRAHLKARDGRVSTTAMMAEVSEILNGEALKN